MHPLDRSAGPIVAAQRSLRILHLPDVVAGNATALAAGERALGAKAETLSYRTSSYGYAADRILRHTQSGMARRWLEKLKVFAEVRSGYDIYHFNFGSTLLHSPQRGMILPDLPYYDRRARCFMTFQGDDARVAYPRLLAASIEEELRRGRLTPAQAAAGYASPGEIATRQRVIEKAARYCHRLFALNPDLLASLPKDQTTFLPYAVEPMAAAERDSEDDRADRPLRLVHLSTSPAIKGTGLIERAVAAAAERCAVTLDVVIQRPRSEALARLAAADYLIDQVVLGWYGGTAVEAMWLGVPAICWMNEEQMAAVPDIARELPILGCTVENLAELIVRLAGERERRDELVRQGFAFAAKWHAPESVAKCTLAAYAAARSS
jgi:hypothetical protein